MCKKRIGEAPMDTQRQFQKGNTMCALEGTHQKDKKWKDIPGGGETRSRGGSWRKVCKISFRWMNRGKKKIWFQNSKKHQHPRLGPWKRNCDKWWLQIFHPFLQLGWLSWLATGIWEEVVCASLGLMHEITLLHLISSSLSWIPKPKATWAILKMAEHLAA